MKYIRRHFHSIYFLLFFSMKQFIGKNLVWLSHRFLLLNIKNDENFIIRPTFMFKHSPFSCKVYKIIHFCTSVFITFFVFIMQNSFTLIHVLCTISSDVNYIIAIICLLSILKNNCEEQVGCLGLLIYTNMIKWTDFFVYNEWTQTNGPIFKILLLIGCYSITE